MRSTRWMARFAWLPLETVEAHLPEIEERGVGKVARSKRGFLAAYRRARGDVSKLARRKVPGIDRDVDWAAWRDGFVARHLAQYEAPGGKTRRRWLALVLWAHIPKGKPPPRG